MASLPSRSAHSKALKRHQGALSHLFHGTDDTATVAGIVIVGCSVLLGPVMEEMEGIGAVERRGITLTFDKSKFDGTPPSSATITHDGKDYTLLRRSGDEAWKTSWKLEGVEKNRTP